MNYQLRQRQIVINRLALNNRNLNRKNAVLKMKFPLVFILGLFVGAILGLFVGVTLGLSVGVMI